MNGNGTPRLPPEIPAFSPAAKQGFTAFALHPETPLPDLICPADCAPVLFRGSRFLPAWYPDKNGIDQSLHAHQCSFLGKYP